MITLPVEGYDMVTGLVPQRAPMLMIDSLEEADDKHAVTTLHISAGNIFYRDLFFTVPGIIEHIAQTAAAHNGYINIKLGRKVSAGYIAVVKNLKVYRLPVVGETLRTGIMIINEVMDYVIANGRVEALGGRIADCELRIFIPGNGEKNN